MSNVWSIVPAAGRRRANAELWSLVWRVGLVMALALAAGFAARLCIGAAAF